MSKAMNIMSVSSLDQCCARQRGITPRGLRAVSARALSGTSIDGDVRATFACLTPKQVLPDPVPALA